MGITETVTDLLDPVVATLDVELVDVEWNGNTLRVVIDGPSDQGVTTDQLAKVNRLAGPILDQHEPIPGRYTLEVSSPGVERSLSKPDHYARAVGEDVIVKLNPGVEPRRIKGTLVSSDAEMAVIDANEIDGVDLKATEQHTVNLLDVAKARTFFDWGPKPKPGGQKNGKQKNSKKSSKNKQAPSHQKPNTQPNKQSNTQSKERDKS